jgi:hypothetical protein
MMIYIEFIVIHMAGIVCMNNKDAYLGYLGCWVKQQSELMGYL